MVRRSRLPDQPPGFGPAFTGLSNTRRETLAVNKPTFDLKALPFDLLDVTKDADRLPFEPSIDADMGE